MFRLEKHLPVITLKQSKLPPEDLWGQLLLLTLEIICLPPPLAAIHTSGTSRVQGCCIYAPFLPSHGLNNHQTYGKLERNGQIFAERGAWIMSVSSSSLCLFFVLLEFVVLRENKLGKKVKGTEKWFLIFFRPVGCDAVGVCSVFVSMGKPFFS